jgi:hypothetical protein
MAQEQEQEQEYERGDLLERWDGRASAGRARACQQETARAGHGQGLARTRRTLWPNSRSASGSSRMHGSSPSNDDEAALGGGGLRSWCRKPRGSVGGCECGGGDVRGGAL